MLNQYLHLLEPPISLLLNMTKLAIKNNNKVGEELKKEKMSS